MDRRREIQRELADSGKENAILDRLEGEVERIVDELLRSREEAAGLRARLEEAEEAELTEGSSGELVVLREENGELRVKLEKIAVKAKEMLKRLDVIEGG